MDIDSKFEAVYVTRSYLTRHGVGPLPGECNKSCLWGDAGAYRIVDETNTDNEFQGGLRYARMDWDSLFFRITRDALAYSTKAPMVSLAITHTNEMPVPENLHDRAPINSMYLSEWKTRDRVICKDKR